MNKNVLLLVLSLFAALTAYCASQVGLLNLLVHNLNHPAGWQIFSDLFIALSMLMVFMARHAKENGRSVWPWVALTLAVGSFGPMLYFLTAKEEG